MCSEQWALLHTHTHTHTDTLRRTCTRTLAQWSRRSTLSNPMVYPSKDFLFLFFFVPPLSSLFISVSLRNSMSVRSADGWRHSHSMGQNLSPWRHTHTHTHTHTCTHTAFEEEASYARSTHTLIHIYCAQKVSYAHTRTCAHALNKHVCPHTPQECLHIKPPHTHTHCLSAASPVAPSDMCCH